MIKLLLCFLLTAFQTVLDKSKVSEKKRKRVSKKVEEEESSCDEDDELWKSMECVTENKQTKTASEH